MVDDDQSPTKSSGFAAPPQYVLDAVNAPVDEDDPEVVLALEKDPFRLKEIGTMVYKEGNIELAVRLWRRSLAKYFSVSMSQPTAELRQLGILLRGNLAMAAMKQGEWADALGELQILLEQEPNDLKALYRKAKCQVELGDYSKAFALIRAVIDDPECDASSLVAFKALNNEALERAQEEREIRDKASKFLFSKNFSPEAKGSMYDDKVQLPAVEDMPPIEDCFAWEDNEVDDLTHETNIFNEVKPGCEFSKTSAQLHYSLPLTVLRVLEGLCLKDATGNHVEDSRRKRLLFDQIQISNISRTRSLKLHEMLSRKAYDDVEKKTKLIPFTIHVIGSSGDFELQAKWTSLLRRLPKVDHMQIVLIGFDDPEDPYGAKLQRNALSPPMANNRDLMDGQKLHMYLFRGSYPEFLYKTQFPKPAALADGEPVPFPAENCMIKSRTGVLFPDLVVMPQPNFQKRFNEMIPVTDYLLQMQIPLIMTAYSALPPTRINGTHEMRYLPAIMNALNAQVVLMPSYNPFCMKCSAPTEEEPPILSFSHYEKNEDGSRIPMFKSDRLPTGMNVGVAVYWGSNKGSEYKPLRGIGTLKKELIELNVDVSSEEVINAINQDKKFGGHGTLENYQNTVEAKAREQANLINKAADLFQAKRNDDETMLNEDDATILSHENSKE